MKIIELVVSPTGQTTMQTQGFSGSACREASRLLEQALGKVLYEKLTEEFYQAHPENHLRQAT